MSKANSDLPCIPDFMECNCSECSDFEDYARNLADEIGLLNEIPEEVARYFNWDSWISDLEGAYDTCNNPESGVFVFRNL